MRLRVNHRIEARQLGKTVATHPVPNGYPDPPCVFEAGDEVDAKLAEVKDLVARRFGGEVNSSEAALTPIGVDPVPVYQPGEEVDLQELSDEELAFHAQKFHGMNAWAIEKKFNPHQAITMTNGERGVLVRDILEQRKKNSLN